MLKKLKIASGLLALCFSCSAYFAWTYYATHRPSFPALSGGRNYPLNSHGAIVYLTSSEHYLLYGLQAATVVFFVLAAASYFLGDEWRNRPRKKQ